MVLLAPSGARKTWRARYTDPDTGRVEFTRLDPLGAGKNEQSRRIWAIAKAKAIGQRKDEISSGAPVLQRSALAETIGRYYTDHPRLRPKTIKEYTAATTHFLAFAQARGIKTTDAVTGPVLVAFRGYLESLGARGVVKGGKRGTRRAGKRLREAVTVNKDLRGAKTVLTYLRRLGLLPKLTSDDVSDGLKALAVSHDAPDFLRSAEIRQLLGACAKHDAATFTATRAEHAGDGTRGTTRRYDPITPIVAVGLLSGMRFGEIASLDWSEVDLQENEIRLTSKTKTKKARTLDLSVSPALVGVLRAQAPKDKRKGRVWTMTEDQIIAASKRLATFGAPESWGWQSLRRTCGTYLTNAPGIFGAASAYRSARQLGHSVQVAERHYLGVVKVPKTASTLEAAMGVEDEVAQWVVP